MDKEIKGIVRQNPIMMEQSCMFVVEQEKGSYLIVLTDIQAAKDSIFVEQGQEISIRGSCLETSYLKGVVITKEAVIKVKKINTEISNTNL